MNRPPPIPWTRFWCPLGATINCGDDGRGFLANPESEYGEMQNPNVQRLEDFLPEIGPLILCGDPGIGKTTEFKKLKAGTEDALIALNFRQHISDVREFRDRTVENVEWKSWREGSGKITLMVDGVDEGLFRIPAFVSALSAILEDEPLDRLRLILTCRSAAWPHAQGDSLLGLWPQKPDQFRPIYELCPLRYADVELAVETWNIDKESFNAALMRGDAVGLATRPVTLLMLLEEFAIHSTLPSSHRELYHRGTLKLASEIDPQRLEILRASRASTAVVSPNLRLQAAQRLAALILCGGKRAILRDETGTETSEPREIALWQSYRKDGTIPPVAFSEVIESALFTSVGLERFGFMHQTFAECLASAQLGSLPLTQVRRLLMQRDVAGEHVIPQLNELAAWTAGHHAEFCEHLLQTDPTSLLHCDASVLSDDLKHRLVRSILTGVESGQILDDYELYKFFHTLKHPGLLEQLRPCIASKAFQPSTRTIAIEIAERCRLEELTDALLAIVADHDDPVRKEAAEAVCEIIPEARLVEIEPLARGESGPDASLCIRGYSLRRLVPSRWSVCDALPHIVMNSKPNFIGVYHMFLEHRLPELLKLSDVPYSLDWLRNNLAAFHSSSSRNKFAKKVFISGLKHLDSVAISTAFVQLWFALAKDHLTHTLATSFELNKLLENQPGLKRMLVSTILNSTIPKDLNFWFLFFELRIVTTSGDFGWLLEQVRSASPDRRVAWAKMISGHIYSAEILSPCWDDFIKCLTSVDELREELCWLRAWDINEPMARTAKARWLRDKRQHEKFERQFQGDAQDPRPFRENALRRSENEDPDDWYSLWHVLHWGNDAHNPTSFTSIAVDSYKGWDLLTLEEQELVRRSARVFLLNYTQNTDHWEPGSEAATSSTSALWLLRDSLEFDQELATACSERWIRLFSGFHFNEDNGASELFEILNRIDHDACVVALLADIERDRPKMRRPFAIRITKPCWDERFDRALRTYAESLNDPKMISATIDEWKALDAAAAGAYAVDLLRRCLAEVGCTYPVILLEILAAAMIVSPAQSLTLSAALLADDEALARAVWSKILHDSDVRGEAWWSHWSEDDMADIFVRLLQLFPRPEDPHHDVGFVAPRTSVAWARDQIPSLLAARSTRAACQALAGLIVRLPEHALNMRWHYRNALVQCRRNEWTPPSAEDIARIVDNADSRLVASDLDLLELVLESLERFQRHLTHDTLPAVEELWNHLPGESARTRRLEPKSEQVLQHAVARWLRDDLGPKRGIVVNCEVEPRPGQFTDIYVDAIRGNGTGTFDRMTVVIEVKGGWHAEVQSAMHTQLVNGYLRGNGLAAGIYLVGWFVCDACPNTPNRTGTDSIEAARTWLNGTVARYDGRTEPEHVSGVVLDCRFPTAAPSRRPAA